MTIPYDPDYKDPCSRCRYYEQACAYVMDGNKLDDACMDKKRWLRHQRLKPKNDVKEKINSPPSCEMCEHFYKDSPTRYSLCRKFDQQIDGEDIAFVSRHGCLFHPLTRSWLNRDVIRELERLTHCKHMLDDGSCRYDEKCDACNIGDFEGSFYEIRKAIALLNGGAGK